MGELIAFCGGDKKSRQVDECLFEGNEQCLSIYL